MSRRTDLHQSHDLPHHPKCQKIKTNLLPHVMTLLMTIYMEKVIDISLPELSQYIGLLYLAGTEVESTEAFLSL